MGRQSQSVSAWILVLPPPRERLMAWFRSPFSARGRAVRLHGRRADKHLGRGIAGACQGMEEIYPDARLPRRPWRPSEHSGCRASCAARSRMAHRSNAAGLQNMDDAADHPAVVHPRLAARVPRQMRFDPRKLRIRQPEQVPIHPHFLPEAVNHNPRSTPNTLWVWTLGLL